ncbi:polysaccharide biosynthesis C-terminal domain-containing protein [Tsuneonella deserti]|nr:NAD-dependent epimerase/dehydratase family protein [Tsuneonella deserti]
MKIVVTGARGLLGWHAAARLHARNCDARFRGDAEPFELVCLDRDAFGDDANLAAAISGADAVLNFAGINRGTDDDVEAGNPAIATRLVEGCKAAGAAPHIVYANSVHCSRDNSYGRSKAGAARILRDFAGSKFTDLVLPHIFGECARPDYNNVTATLIDRIARGETPEINPNGAVELLHAGEAADLAIAAALEGGPDLLEPQGRKLKVSELYDTLLGFHASYTGNVFPDLLDPFDLALFNSYRTGLYPQHYPRMLKLNSDARGTLFEAAKGGNASQSFLSTTAPGIRRGDHFHTSLVERFLVVRGEAVIRIRKVLTDEVETFTVSGREPAAIDMPPLHTHHIENTGKGELLTYFWAHRMFEPLNPDTFADPVLGAD